MDEIDFDLSKQASWHSGLPSVMRLHYWLQEGNLRAYQEDYVNRKKAHDRFYIEIKSKLNEKEKAEVEKVKDEVDNEMNNITISGKHKLISSKLPALLDKYEDLIRLYADNHAMMIPNQQDPARSILS